MIVHTLEQRWEILRHYFENHSNVAESVRKLLTDFGRREAMSAPYIRYLVKKGKKLASSSINQNVKTQKQCVRPTILLLWRKVGMKRHQHPFTVVLNNWTFRWYHWDEFCIKALVWPNTKFNWFRSWNQLTIQYVFASLNGFAIDLQKMPILAKKIFSDEAHFDLGGYVNNRNCRIWGTENPHANIENDPLLGADFGSEP